MHDNKIVRSSIQHIAAPVYGTVVIYFSLVVSFFVVAAVLFDYAADFFVAAHFFGDFFKLDSRSINKAGISGNVIVESRSYGINKVIGRLNAVKILEVKRLFSPLFRT